MDQPTDQTPPQTSTNPDEPVSQPPPVTPETSHVTKPKSKLLVPLLVIFGLILLGAAVFAGYNLLSPKSCTVDGVNYKAGESFPAEDECNTCTCSEDGDVFCTLIACVDEPIPVVDTAPIPGGEDATVLFEKEEGWGPCPPDSLCTQKTTLYNSGELVMVGEENTSQTLDQETLDNIKSAIRSSDIMTADCGNEVIVDYSATYTINLDGATKVIQFPGCEGELQEIEELLVTN